VPDFSGVIIVSKLNLTVWAFRVFVILGAVAAPSSAEVEQVGRLSAKDIEESSGLVASRRHADVLYTHNDSGGAPVVFAIRPDGSLLKQFRVPAKHTDWEDIATDEAGRLYIANTGNNTANRDTLEVHRLAEPNLGERAVNRKNKAKKNDTRAEETRLRVERSWRLSFQGRPFNCESLFIHKGYGYLISKVDPGQAAMYRFALDEKSEDVSIEKVIDLPLHRPVTGADLSPDGKRLAVGADREQALFEVDGDPATAGRQEPKRISLPAKKIEAVAWTANGLLMTAESREIYRWREPATPATPPAAQP
jgi:hypothetical protein